MRRLFNNPIRSSAPPATEAKLAEKSSIALAKFASTEIATTLTLRIEDAQTGESVETTIPASAVPLFARALSQMAEGMAETPPHLEEELSEQQAAEFLGVSVSYFARMLEQGKMPFRKAGGQHRVRYSEVVLYRNAYCLAANAALDEMTQEAQRLGLYE